MGKDRDNNDAGNVCDSDVMCKGNFDFDSDVDSVDAFVFKQHFGRSELLNRLQPKPCPGLMLKSDFVVPFIVLKVL